MQYAQNNCLVSSNRESARIPITMNRDRKLFLHNRLRIEVGIREWNYKDFSNSCIKDEIRISLLCFNRKTREEFPRDYASPRVIVPRIVSYRRDSFVSGPIEASETPLLLFSFPIPSILPVQLVERLVTIPKETRESRDSPRSRIIPSTLQNSIDRIKISLSLSSKQRENCFRVIRLFN